MIPEASVVDIACQFQHSLELRAFTFVYISVWYPKTQKVAFFSPILALFVVLLFIVFFLSELVLGKWIAIAFSTAMLSGFIATLASQSNVTQSTTQAVFQSWWCWKKPKQVKDLLTDCCVLRTESMIGSAGL